MTTEHPDGELVHGEIVPANSASRRLTSAQLQGAVIDAAGQERQEIARLVGVSESAVKQWRKMPEYKDEVDRLKAANAAAISEPMRKFQEEIIEGGRDAITALKELCYAEDKHGDPLHVTRQTAAQTLLKHGIDMAKDGGSRGGPTAQVAAGAVVKLDVNVKRD